MNSAVLVGRIIDIQREKDEEGNVKELVITIAIPRNYKNGDGIYDTDTVPVRIKSILAGGVDTYCKLNDVVGIKAKITRLKGKELEIVAEKVSYLASRKENGER